MTELYKLYQADRDAVAKKIKAMDTSVLFAELDDTLQFDVMHKNTADWVNMPEMQLYRALLKEIAKRCIREK